MPAAKQSRRGTSATAGVKAAGRGLERRLARLQEQLKAERARHARQVAAVRRAADRQMAALVREIAILRHHEARAETMARLIAERDTALAAHAERVAQLESLLQAPGMR